MDRRKFISNMSTVAVGSLLVASSNPKMEELVKNIGLQLYTVRDDMAADPEGTLRKLAEIGYAHVENADYQDGKFYGYPTKEFKALLKQLNLKMTSGHILTGAAFPERKGTLINDWERAVNDAKEIGQEFIVCPYLFDFERKKLDDYKRLADLFNKCAEVSKNYGLQFAYHNHDFEFMDMEGQLPIDVLLERTDSELVKFEMDLYWVKFANVDPFTYFERHPKRFPLWHVKDMDDTKEHFFTEVGNGIIDWKPIFQQQQQSGMEYFYVEQDQCKDHQPLESVNISHTYLTKLEY